MYNNLIGQYFSNAQTPYDVTNVNANKYYLIRLWSILGIKFILYTTIFLQQMYIVAIYE